MEFTIERKALLAELSVCEGVTTDKGTIPMLSHVRIEVDGDTSDTGVMTIVGTDLEVAITTTCPVKLKGPGVAVIPGKKLLDYAKRAESGKSVITFKTVEQTGKLLSVSSGASKARMTTLDPATYPELPSVHPASVTLKALDFYAMIMRTQFAISSEDSRYTLDAALLWVQNELITMVATDGHRLALVERPVHNVLAGKPFRELIPKKALAKLVELLGEASDDMTVEIATNDNYLFFTIGHRLLTCRKKVGSFPAYEAVLPPSNGRTAHASIKTSEFIAAMRRVGIFADERTKKISLALGEDSVNVAGECTTLGEAKDDVLAKIDGQVLAVAFNHKYVIEFLEAVGSEEILLLLQDAKSAGEFRPALAWEQAEGLRYRYVVMPMSL